MDLILLKSNLSNGYYMQLLLNYLIALYKLLEAKLLKSLLQNIN